MRFFHLLLVMMVVLLATIDAALAITDHHDQASPTTETFRTSSTETISKRRLRSQTTANTNGADDEERALNLELLKKITGLEALNKFKAVRATRQKEKATSEFVQQLQRFNIPEDEIIRAVQLRKMHTP